MRVLSVLFGALLLISGLILVGLTAELVLLGNQCMSTQGCNIGNGSDFANATFALFSLGVVSLVGGIVLLAHGFSSGPAVATNVGVGHGQTIRRRWKCGNCGAQNVSERPLPPGSIAFCSSCGSRQRIIN